MKCSREHFFCEPGGASQDVALCPTPCEQVLKSKRITVTVPGEFVELIEERKREEHFSSDSKYFQSLLLFDLLTRAPHAITGQVVNDPEWLQNKVYAEIVREFPNARKDWSPWLKRRIEELRKLGEKSASAEEPPL